ncbi:DUF4232 domain-containing protein [Conexibacter sp. CPCC 206217]|uniref:DUF4232 domain-containing protein n=1 Tax=Conexibacter sp. CPCC 206217 TaxID=3064574 RepID=UPI0027177F4C|nr:DUF4232 domain-containing protein [Conexibacter sp. CPCC 206217]MDO8209961.1 DUF4232 domain-containing protein [Conexibacter sp. CPCC 206217]
MPRLTLLPLRRGRRAASLLAAAATTAACLTAVAAPSATAATPRCTTAKLLGEFKKPSAGAGSRFVNLVLTNHTRKSCSVFNYPGAQLLGKTNAELPTQIVRDRSRTPKTVVLKPGESAESAWRWGAIAGRGEPTKGPCEITPARIEITPPNDFQHLVLPWRMGPVCERGTITVRPMIKP